MKKNVIALLLSLVLAAGNVGAVPVMAAEVCATEEAAAEEKVPEEEAPEEEPGKRASEEESAQEEEVPAGEGGGLQVETPGETEETDEGLNDEDASEEESAQEMEGEADPEAEVSSDGDEGAGGEVMAEDGATEGPAAVEEETEEYAKEADSSAVEAGTDETAVIEEELATEEGQEAELAEDVVDSGTCGDNATWTLTGTDSDLTLTISGSGAMKNFYGTGRPWASNSTKIKTVIVEDGITSVGDCAFYWLNKMTSVSLGDNVSYIGKCAFSNCTSLKSVMIPNGVTEIREDAFSECESLKSVTIPDSVTKIGESAFSSCNLKEIHISSLEAWLNLSEYYSFSSGELYLNGELLTNAVIPDGITKVRQCAFFYCSSLESVIIPDSVTEIGYYAFSCCSSLKSVTIPNSVTKIGYEAFTRCSSLESITIPASVTVIGESAFYGCSSLTSVTIPDGVTGIWDETFSCCSSLKSVTIPASVTSIWDEAFYGCSSLESVTIPASVTSIGDYAFGDSDINTSIRFRGTKDQWDKAAADRNVYYKSIVYNYFSVDADFRLSGTSFEYTGKEIKPDVTVTCGDKELAEGTDYELVYKDNINAGTAGVDINGIGTYSGTATETFTIDPKPVSELTVSGIAARTYTGKALYQNPVVRDGDVKLVKGTDYKISHKNNTNIGTGTVSITGIGNYTGTVAKNFTIKKAVNRITAKNFTKTYSAQAQTFALGVKISNGTPKYVSSSKSVTVTKAGKVTVKAKFIGKATITITAPEYKNYSKTTRKITVTVNPTKTALSSVTSPSAGKITVKWKKNAVGTGYQIQYSTSSKFTSVKSVWITKNTAVSRTIGSLTKGKKYYVRIRTYKKVGTVKYYSGWGTVKAVTVKK